MFKIPLDKPAKILILFIAIIYLPLWAWTIHQSDVLKQTNGIREDQVFPLYGSDSYEYATIAKNVLSGNGFSKSVADPFVPDTVRTPGYPLLIAGLEGSTGSLFSVTFIQIFLVMIIAVMIYKLTVNLTKKKVLAFFCSLLFVLDPAVIIFSLTIYNDVLFALTLLTAFWLIFVETQDSIRRFAGAGALLGFLVLVKPSGTYLVILIPVLFFVFYFKNFGAKRALTLASICLVSSIVILSPWVIRNKIKTGTAHISSLTTSYLYVDYIPRFEAWRNNATDYITYWNEHQEEYQKKHNMTVEESARPENHSRVMAVFMDNFLQYPFQNIKYYLIESRYFHYNQSTSLFSLMNLQYNRLFTKGKWTEPVPQSVISTEKFLRLAIIGFAILGLLAGRKNKIILVSSCIFIYLWLVAGPIGIARLRIHAEPFLLILTGVGINSILNLFKRKINPKERNGSFVPEKSLDKILHKWRCSKIYPFVKDKTVVIDLGCGMEGNLLKSLKEKQIAKGIGVDFQVDKNFEDEKITLVTSDLNNPLPLESGSADLITSMAVLEHLHNYEGFVKEIYRILKNGGKVVISTPTIAADPVLKILGILSFINKEEIEDHKRYFNKKQLEDLFRASGFKNIKTKYFQLGFNQLLTAEK